MRGRKIIMRISTLFSFIKNEIKYQFIKNLKPNQYESFLKEEYKRKTGKKINLFEPKTYTEKMHYSKLYDNTPLKTLLSDKYLVREWITDKIGSEYLIPLLGAWDKYSDVDFEVLPEKFVLKTNHGSGTNLVIQEKSKVNHFKERLKFNLWMSKNFAYMGDLQLHYKDIAPLIIAEKYLEDSNKELNDYKFICFNGKPHYCWVDIGRYSNHYRNVYNMDWVLQPWNYNEYSNFPKKIPKPQNFEKMIKIATILSQGFSHVRVDLYNIDGEIFFGEMTFTNSGGYALFYPQEYDIELGKLWDISDIEYYDNQSMARR